MLQVKAWLTVPSSSFRVSWKEMSGKDNTLKSTGKLKYKFPSQNHSKIQDVCSIFFLLGVKLKRVVDSETLSIIVFLIHQHDVLMEWDEWRQRTSADKPVLKATLKLTEHILCILTGTELGQHDSEGLWGKRPKVVKLERNESECPHWRCVLFWKANDCTVANGWNEWERVLRV